MIVITGGGTGGHLAIAKVIKEELNKRGITPIFIGSINGQDKKWFENDNGWKATYFLNTSGVVNKKGFSKINSLIRMFIYLFEIKKIFKQHNIQKVFSVGGYSAGAASFGAILFKKELYIHEQNNFMGRLNKLLSPFAKQVFSSFFYNDDYPVREEFFLKARVRDKIKTIIFLGGSQGAVTINNFAFEVAKTKKYKIIHQTGAKDYKRCKDFYLKNRLNVDYFDFDDNLVEKISEADLAISRAGASTLFELISNQLPTIFVPYPYAAGNHQYFNAKFLSDKNLCFLKLQDELSVDFIDNIDSIKTISQNLKNLNHLNGAKKIVDVILS